MLRPRTEEEAGTWWDISFRRSRRAVRSDFTALESFDLRVLIVDFRDELGLVTLASSEPSRLSIVVLRSARSDFRSFAIAATRRCIAFLSFAMSVAVEVTVVVVGAVEVFALVLLLELDGAVDATLESVSVEEVDVLLGALLAVFVEDEDEGLADAVVVEEDGDDVFELVLLFELVGAVDATLESVSVEEADVLLGVLLAVFVEEDEEAVFELVLLVFADETSFFKDA